MDRKFFELILIHCVTMITCCMALIQTNIDTDQSALLALKNHITSDPHQILSKNWLSNAPSSSVCDWIGVQCGSRHRRVIALNVSGMDLTGTIPPHLGNLSFLTALDMTDNYFHGTLPPESSRLRRIRFIMLDNNNFSGPVPTWFAPNLQILSLGFNYFGGSIPSSISHLSNLEILNLQSNALTGNIPGEMGNLQRLTVLNLEDNYLVGSIPSSIFNISTLEQVGLTFNNLTGSLPVDICHNDLPNLTEIHFAYNQFNGTIPPSISHCFQLQILSLSYNNFSGFIPKELSNLDMLEELYMGGNNLQGEIPREIGNLRNLERLGIERNRVSGLIPKEIGNLTNLTYLNLGSNSLTGIIPEEVGNLQKMAELSFENNYLVGSIPSSIFNIPTLEIVHLTYNNLTGFLPNDICHHLPNLKEIDLSGNQLSGQIPPSLCFCSQLQILSLSYNTFNGSIPKQIGNLQMLKSLDLGSNHHLTGVIPREIGNLHNLQNFYVNTNKISGSIPKELGNLTMLTRLRLGENYLTVLALAFALRRCRKKSKPSRESTIVVPTQERISYYEVLQATGRLDESNLLGSGTFGSVYKGILVDGRFIAVKVFKFQVAEAFKSFDVECDIFRNVRHRNIVKVISSCSNHDFKALVLQYMSNDSLETWLYSHNHFLTIIQRLDIMIDVASALHYLHHEYTTTVIHCDLKPSNVLLDEDMVAHVSDFGIAKMSSKEESMALTKTFATIGYIAPEYGTEGLISRRCDVYSYGIMLMEVFTRKRPSDEMFSGDLNLKTWVNNAMVADSILAVIDANLLTPTEEHLAEKLECLSSIMELALKCVCESPKDRVSMIDVFPSLNKMKLKLLQNV